jgi:hypothetical protein
MLSYALVTQLILHNDGQVSTLQAYWDSACTIENRTTIIHWGNSLAPNSTQTQTIYVKNGGGKSVNMTLLTANWNPTNAKDYMAVTWNRENEALPAGMVLQSTITLTVFANITDANPAVGSFSFDVLISGTY